jgi:5-methylcytosine-specific restriction endonuclease McrA
MRKINKPTFKVIEVLDDCIDNMRESDLKTEIISSKAIFTDAEILFEKNKITNELHKIPHNKIISKTLNAEELKDIYTSRLVNKNNIGRKYYDSIFLSAPNGKCPYCAQRIVRTLDHYLPKSKYPIYSITPVNLVPSCSDCNKDKLIDTPTKEEEETLHPYYDDVENESWLKLKIISQKPLTVEYFVSPPTTWNTLLVRRTEFHFKSYSLNILYCIHALEEFENIKNQIIQLFNSSGSVGLKQHLLDCFQSRQIANKNSWQTAFYEGLANDSNFTNGEFI